MGPDFSEARVSHTTTLPCWPTPPTARTLVLPPTKLTSTPRLERPCKEFFDIRLNYRFFGDLDDIILRLASAIGQGGFAQEFIIVVTFIIDNAFMTLDGHTLHKLRSRCLWLQTIRWRAFLTLFPFPPHHHCFNLIFQCFETV